MRDSVHDEKVWEKAATSASFQVQMDKPDCVVMDSGYCSMGRMIAMKACKASGYAFYDAEALLELLDLSDDQKKGILAYDDTLETYQGTAEDLVKDPQYQHVSGVYEKAIALALAKGKCLIHERASVNLVTSLGYSVFSVITFSCSQQMKRERAVTSPVFREMVDNGMDVDTLIERQDHKRRMYRNAQDPAHPWGVMESYDLCLNTDMVGREKSIELLTFLLK